MAATIKRATGLTPGPFPAREGGDDGPNPVPFMMRAGEPTGVMLVVCHSPFPFREGGRGVRPAVYGSVSPPSRSRARVTNPLTRGTL
jgi:hypothetical protein